jgi:hypothetical protein
MKNDIFFQTSLVNVDEYHFHRPSHDLAIEYSNEERYSSHKRIDERNCMVSCLSHETSAVLSSSWNQWKSSRTMASQQEDIDCILCEERSRTVDQPPSRSIVLSEKRQQKDQKVNHQSISPRISFFGIDTETCQNQPFPGSNSYRCPLQTRNCPMQESLFLRWCTVGSWPACHVIKSCTAKMDRNTHTHSHIFYRFLIGHGNFELRRKLFLPVNGGDRFWEFLADDVQICS